MANQADRECPYPSAAEMEAAATVRRRLPSVYELWLQAGGETPDAYDRDRFIALMKEHGYILSPGDDGYAEAPKGLPCGWPPNRSDEKEPIP
jgi:hypothetical protein